MEIQDYIEDKKLRENKEEYLKNTTAIPVRIVINKESTRKIILKYFYKTLYLS
jgi:hypothetical protein